MPAKINVTSHISCGHGRTKFFQNPDGRETTLATAQQDDNNNTYEADILCSLTKGVRKGRFWGSTLPLSLIFYKNFITCTKEIKEINSFRIFCLLICRLHANTRE